MRPACPFVIVAGALIAGLAGCAVGPDFKRPEAPAAAGYGVASSQEQTDAAQSAAGDAQHFLADTGVPSDWWTLFQSPKLNGLVEQALKANPNVQAAQAALRQAHELYVVQRSSFFPAVQGSFGAARSQFPTNTLTSPTVAPSSTYTLYTAQLTLSYEPDLFGGTRRQVEIAKAQEQSTRFQLEATYLTLSTNVVVAAIQEACCADKLRRPCACSSWSMS